MVFYRLLLSHLKLTPRTPLLTDCFWHCPSYFIQLIKKVVWEKSRVDFSQAKNSPSLDCCLFVCIVCIESGNHFQSSLKCRYQTQFVTYRLKDTESRGGSWFPLHPHHLTIYSCTLFSVLPDRAKTSTVFSYRVVLIVLNEKTNSYLACFFTWKTFITKSLCASITHYYRIYSVTVLTFSINHLDRQLNLIKECLE